jgi:hypothetical protein
MKGEAFRLKKNLKILTLKALKDLAVSVFQTINKGGGMKTLFCVEINSS